jgi:ABC-2 type transport system ATP-binding protein
LAQLSDINHAVKPTECALVAQNGLTWITVSNAVDISNLSVNFGSVEAVRDVSFSLQYGEILALLGPNGAGKTTIVDTLLGFRPPTAGTARIHGLDPIRDHHEMTLRTGALLQRGGVWFPMTPRQVLTLTASYYEFPRPVDELIDLLSLRTAQNTPWRRLSGGEQQRTLLALALVGRPKALVLDEPTTAVDPEGRAAITTLLETERARGVAILLTTHELDVAEKVANRIVIVHRGSVVASGTLDELSGESEIVVETNSAMNAGEVATALQCTVRSDGPRMIRILATPTPTLQANLLAFLESKGNSLVSMRTRASLEQRYLEIIELERSGQ